MNFSLPKCLYGYFGCHYRKKSRYFYKSVATGEIQWEYPGPDVGEELSKTEIQLKDEDAMDICTTPPPNIEEQLMEQPLAKKLRQKDSKGKPNCVAPGYIII